MTRPAGGAAVAAVLSIGMLAGCGGTVPGTGADIEPAVSVDRITDRPADFAGERVRLSGRVAEVYSARALSLRDDDPVRQEHLLVVTRRPVARLLGESGGTLHQDDELLVTGVIRVGDLPGLEAELGIELEERIRNRFRGKPVLVASELVRTDVRGSASPDTVPPPD
jgi:hypothetical protein